MKTAAAYLRVSTEAQDEYSLDSQLKLIRSYAASHDMVVPDELVFTDDGISGRSAKKRPEFQRMIGWAKDKYPECNIYYPFIRYFKLTHVNPASTNYSRSPFLFPRFLRQAVLSHLYPQSAISDT